MSSDRELAIKLAADASDLNQATKEGAAGFNSLGAAGKKAGEDAQAGATAMTSAARAEAAAIDQARRTSADALRAQQQAMREHRAEANLLKQANRQLAMQMTDVVTSVASGMPVWMVAIQQGGQIRDAYGGVGASLRAIGALITPAVAGMAALAAAGGSVALAYYQGWQQSKAFRDGMALTGNTAAITEGQFNSLVQSLAQARSVAAGDVRDLMQVLATSGEQTGATLESSARAALSLSRLNGQAAADNAKAFQGMANSVTDWSAKANKAYNFLTAEQYKQIMALEAQGRTAEAMRLSMDALSGTLDSRTAPSLGYIESALKGVTTWWGNMWDAANGWGRAETADERIAKLQERIGGMDAWMRKGGYGGSTAFKDASAALEMELKERARLALRGMDQASAQAAEQEAILKASRSYQDSLLAIQTAGDALQYAQQNAGFAQRKAATEQAYAELTISGQTYRDRMIGIERERIAAQEANARQSVEIERSRVVKTEQEANARAAAVLSAQAKLAALAGERARLAADIAAGRFDPKARSVIETPQSAFRRDEIMGDQAAAQIRAQTEATRQLAAAQAEYVRGLEEAMASRAADNNRDLAGRRLGDDARGVLARQGGIADQFNTAMQVLRRDLDAKTITGGQFAEREAALRAYYDWALGEEERYQAERSRIESDATVGFDRAMAQYAESSRNTARQTEELWSDAFAGMEDALVRFTMTGKGSFTAMANSIVADLVRIYIRQQMAGMVGAMFGASTPTGATGDFARMDRMAGTVGHTGGVVGREAMDGTRMMPASTWANAPRLHTGRLAGNEYAAILQRDESVLTPGQMSQLAPAGGSRGAAVTLDLKVINQTGTPVNATGRRTSGGGIELLLTSAEESMAGNVAQGQGPMYAAFKSRFNLRD